MRLSVDAVRPQLRQVGGQLVVADSSGLAAPEWATGDDAIWMSIPAATPYELRQAGYARAGGDIVAVTEDHCAAAPDWLTNVLAEHERLPDAAAIFGVVENGSQKHMIDWALYGVGYITAAPPAPNPDSHPSHANLSFKAHVLREVAATEDAVLEFRYLERLRNSGYEVIASDKPRVTHVQSTGVATTSSLFFHNGRYIAATRRQRMGRMDWLRAFAPGLLAGYRTMRTLQIARSKPSLTAVMYRSAPYIAMLHVLHATGESIGYLTGPGDSPRHLH